MRIKNLRVGRKGAPLEEKKLKKLLEKLSEFEERKQTNTKSIEFQQINSFKKKIC